MRDVDKGRAQAEAKAAAAAGSHRPGIWAALNRYLAAEAVVEHQHSEQDRDRDAAEHGPVEQREPDESEE